MICSWNNSIRLCSHNPVKITHNSFQLPHCQQELQTEKDLNPLSISKYRQQITFFCHWLGERDPSAELATLFLAELRQQGYSRSSIRSYYAAIRPFLKWRGIEFKLKLKKIRRLPHYHTKDEIDRLIQAIAQRQDAWAKKALRRHMAQECCQVNVIVGLLPGEARGS